jgi:hypothetical protein
MNSAGDTPEQAALRTCTTKALEALAGLNLATETLRRLTVPSDATDKKLHQEIFRNLKRVHGEVMAVLFVTTMVVESTVPQVPRKH